MKINVYKRNSIAFKLAVIFAISILLQSVLISFILLAGGVVDQTKRNAFEFFAEKVSHRKSSLESEMKNVWTNFDQYTDQISQYYSLYGKDQSMDELLVNLSPYLRDALGATKTTGIFLIMEEHNEGATYSSLYLRNADPSRGSSNNANLSLVVGPWAVVENMKITTSENWDFRLQLNRENDAFYKKTYQNSHLTDEERFVGYWSPPFRLTKGDEKIITYSLPLKDNKGNSIGVFGIEISLNYLYKFLPSTDLQSQDAYGYLIGMKTEQDGPLYPIIASGALQSRMLDLNKSIDLREVNQTSNIYKMEHTNSNNQIYACVDKLGLYYSNTPFETEEWYLIGIMDEPVLLEFADKISSILLSSFFFSIFGGLIIAAVVSRRFTKPITDLSEQVQRSAWDKSRPLKATGLAEIDQLSGTINNAQERLLALSQKVSRIIDLTGVPFGAYEINENSHEVFITGHLTKLFHLSQENETELCNDKYKFKAYIKKICENQTDEHDVFFYENEGDCTWIRLIETEIAGDTLGVVMDVTEEMLQKQGLKEERDRDPLTGIRNRNAFNRTMAYYNHQLSETSDVGIGLFDLNDLKLVNDRWGHEKGDQYLCTASDIICSTFFDSLIFRIGGDEFVIIFFGWNENKLHRGHEELLKKSEAYSRNLGFSVGIAFGCSFYDPALDVDLKTVMARADSNMYANKYKMKSIENTIEEK